MTAMTSDPANSNGRALNGLASNDPANSNELKDFGEFRRKVKSAEVLSASMERLLLSLRFTGRVSVVMQNGRVLKSGYEEGYFRRCAAGGVDDESAQTL
jgi:hypothetical protein